VSYVLQVLFSLAFAFIGLAFALDFRGIAGRAAQNSIWNRGESRRARTVLTAVQRCIGAVIALIGVVMTVLIVMSGVRDYLG